MHRTSFAALLGAIVLLAGATAARAAVAVLQQMEGRPAVYEVGEAGARHVALPKPGARYRLPIEIETGPRDSAVFRVPDGNVTIAPNTMMRLAAPEASASGLLQRVFQKSGSGLFSVDHREVQHFQVETPYLVSVVKGTLFTVVVHEEGATVALHQGRLEVDSVDGRQTVMLSPGEVAFSARDGVLRKLEPARRTPPGWRTAPCPAARTAAAARKRLTWRSPTLIPIQTAPPARPASRRSTSTTPARSSPTPW